MYLSDNVNGDDITGTTPDGVLIGTDGFLLSISLAAVTDRGFWLSTNNSGIIDLDIVEVGAQTWYMVVVLPNGIIEVSSAITFV